MASYLPIPLTRLRGRIVAFTTAMVCSKPPLLKNGQVRFLDDHLRRLQSGCERLGIAAPEAAILRAEIGQVTKIVRDGVLKIVISRGAGKRGYRPMPELQTTRLVAVYDSPASRASDTVSLRWCEIRLGRNPRLAGIKHLNRLEQVLAQSEWREGEFDEGLMLDTEGELVCGTASNVFIVREGMLVTPDLRFCGVVGVMRAQVLRAARQEGLAANEEPLWPHDIETASEAFVTNAVHGIRSAVSLGTQRWEPGPVAGKLRSVLGL